MSTGHVIWDWNGTLADDLGLVVEAVNRAIRPFGVGPIGPDDYRTHYTRPVQSFYERLLGRPIAADEWGWLDDRYHAAYHEALAQADLTPGARDALEQVQALGGSQSLLSMYRHDDLVRLVDRYRIAQLFVRVDGLRSPGGGTKAAFLRRHLARLDARPDAAVVVGDALDDAAAAAAVGAGCVLYDGGSHHREELERSGVPVVDSLADALGYAGIA